MVTVRWTSPGGRRFRNRFNDEIHAQQFAELLWRKWFIVAEVIS